MDIDSLNLAELLGSDDPPRSPPPPKTPKGRRRPPSVRPRLPVFDDLDIDRPASPPPESPPLSIESRIAEYLTLALDNLRDDFRSELRTILENASILSQSFPNSLKRSQMISARKFSFGPISFHFRLPLLSSN
jgi:hypothetical protein